MERKILIEQLEKIAPALSDNNLIPVMQHFWFLGNHVLAYNDKIAMQVPLQTEFKAAVPGAILLEMLKRSGAKEADLSLQVDELMIKLAAARIKLPALDESNYRGIFSMPKVIAKPLDGSASKFFEAMQLCMRSISGSTDVPDQQGVTLFPSDKRLMLYSTNGATLTHSNLPLNLKLQFERAILSASFCTQMIKLAKDAKACALEVFDDHAIFKADDVSLWGRLIYAPKPLDYAALLDFHLPDDYTKRAWDIPPNLKLILQRAEVITASKIEATKTAISIKDGVMRFSSQSDRGEIKDQLSKGIGKGQDDVGIKVDPQLFLAGLDFEKLLLTDRCLIMSKPNMIYMVAG